MSDKKMQNYDGSVLPQNKLSVPDKVARQIVENYTKQLESLVRWQLNQKIRCKEGTSAILQDVFKSFFSRPIDFSDPESFHTELLKTITRRKCFKQARKYRNPTRDYRREQPAEVDDGKGNNISSIDLEYMARGPSSEVVMDLIEALYSLSEDELTIVAWLLEELSFAEIGVKLKCSEKTIQRKVSKIRSKLSVLLKDDIEDR